MAVDSGGIYGRWGWTNAGRYGIIVTETNNGQVWASTETTVRSDGMMLARRMIFSHFGP